MKMPARGTGETASDFVSGAVTGAAGTSGVMEDKVAHAIDYTEAMQTPNKETASRRRPAYAHAPRNLAAANTNEADIRDSAAASPETATAETDFELATIYETRAQRLAARVTQIEDGVRLAQLYLSAAEAIDGILSRSSELLDKGRSLPEQTSRGLLAATFEEIKHQIDDIVSEAGFDDVNLAAGDKLDVIFDEEGTHVFQFDSAGLTAEAIGLNSPLRDYHSDAEIIGDMLAIENAIATLRARRTVVELGLTVLQNRVSFAREKILSLHETSRNLVGRDKAYHAVCEIAMRRLTPSEAPPAEAAPLKAESAPNSAVDPQTASRGDALTARSEIDDSLSPAIEARAPESADPDSTPVEVAIDEVRPPEPSRNLDTLAKDLARLLKDSSYLSNWFKYETGESDIFTRQLAKAYGPELIASVAEKYIDDENFRRIADAYMANFESRIEHETGGGSGQKAKIDELLKTDQGTVYVVLIRASDRI